MIIDYVLYAMGAIGLLLFLKCFKGHKSDSWYKVFNAHFFIIENEFAPLQDRKPKNEQNMDPQWMRLHYGVSAPWWAWSNKHYYLSSKIEAVNLWHRHFVKSDNEYASACNNVRAELEKQKKEKEDQLAYEKEQKEALAALDKELEQFQNKKHTKPAEVVAHA